MVFDLQFSSCMKRLPLLSLETLMLLLAVAFLANFFLGTLGKHQQISENRQYKEQYLNLHAQKAESSTFSF